MSTTPTPLSPHELERLSREGLLADLKQHLANMEAYAAKVDGRRTPAIENEGPQHESMAQVIRRLGCGQTCTMSLRYLRAIITELEPPSSLPLPDAEGWWWEWREEFATLSPYGKAWLPRMIERFDGDLVIGGSALLHPKPGQWVPCTPPPAQGEGG